MVDRIVSDQSIRLSAAASGRLQPTGYFRLYFLLLTLGRSPHYCLLGFCRLRILLLDPDEPDYCWREVDSSQRAIESLLGYEDIDTETYMLDIRACRIRVFRNAGTIEDSRVPGYVIKHTGGAVQHGRCIVVGVNESGGLVDVPKVTISHHYVPRAQRTD